MSINHAVSSDKLSKQLQRKWREEGRSEIGNET